ncbi:MAG: hypothetical protein U0W24_04300 [Bacteroidales bacterium]
MQHHLRYRGPGHSLRQEPRPGACDLKEVKDLCSAKESGRFNNFINS